MGVITLKGLHMGEITPDNLGGPHTISSESGRPASRRRRAQRCSRWLAGGRGLWKLEKARKPPSLEFWKEHGSANALALVPEAPFRTSDLLAHRRTLLYFASLYCASQTCSLQVEGETLHPQKDDRWLYDGHLEPHRPCLWGSP